MDEPELPQSEPDARFPRVLVVDDSDATREAIRGILSRPPLQAEVVESADGSAALKRALSEPDLDCVICDIAMPNMDGLTFLRLLRAQRSRLELPVILLTVKEGVTPKVEGFRAGASDFIVKPCENEELIARVETHVVLRRIHQRVDRLTRRLQILVETDALTGLKNRRAFMRLLAAESGRARRTGRPVSMLMIDVDNFKAINDAHGHPTGDRVLCDVAARLDKGARGYDTVARIGGEEFAVLLPEVSVENALGVAERLRATVADETNAGELAIAATVSVGVAIGPYEDDDTGERLFKHADDALYKAKRNGRNRVEIVR